MPCLSLDIEPLKAFQLTIRIEACKDVDVAFQYAAAMSASLLEHVGTFVPTLPKNIEASHSSLKLFIALFTVVLTSEHVDQLVFKVDKRRSIPLDRVLPEPRRGKPRLVEAVA